MTVIHANDPTTQFLSLLYEQRRDISMHITEASTNSAVQRAIREDMVTSMACSRCLIMMAFIGAL